MRKMSIIRILVMVLFLVGSVGCQPLQQVAVQAQTLISSPIPVPKYIDYVSPLPGEQVISPRTICVGVRQAYVWESGNEADELSRHLISNTQLALDGSRIGDADLFIYDTMDLFSRPDGSHSGLLVVCTNSGWALAKGLHLVSMTTKTMSGKELSYEWAFEVK